MTGTADEYVPPRPSPDLLGEPFRLDSIVEVPAPEGGEGVWQQYVIVQGSNTIKGFRSGTRSDVSLQIESMVERLNERFRKAQAGSIGGSGRKSSSRAGRPPSTIKPFAKDGTTPAATVATNEFPDPSPLAKP